MNFLPNLTGIDKVRVAAYTKGDNGWWRKDILPTTWSYIPLPDPPLGWFEARPVTSKAAISRPGFYGKQ